MAARSIASLSLSFGLVSIPIKLYSATESASAIRFKLMAAGGAPVRQQYVTDAPATLAPGIDDQAVDAAPPVRQRAADKPNGSVSRVLDFPNPRPGSAALADDAAAPSSPGPTIVERSDMVKGYEFEKGKFVLFSAAELKALEEGSRQTIDIVSFIPEHAVDPIYYDKAYFLAPDKRGAKPYSLLLRAMKDTGRSALAKWAFRSKEYVVQIRAAEGGMVLQQLLYAEEVRSLADLHIDQVVVGDAELQLAKQLIAQIAAEFYDPLQYVDEEKKRILAAVEQKIEGQQIVAPEHHEASPSGQVVDLVAALRASLQAKSAVAPDTQATTSKLNLGPRKPVKRALAETAKRPASQKASKR